MVLSVLRTSKIQIKNLKFDNNIIIIIAHELCEDLHFVDENH